MEAPSKGDICSGGSEISMKVERGQDLVDITITPEIVKQDDLPGSKR